VPLSLQTAVTLCLPQDIDLDIDLTLIYLLLSTLLIIPLLEGLLANSHFWILLLWCLVFVLVSDHIDITSISLFKCNKLYFEDEVECFIKGEDKLSIAQDYDPQSSLATKIHIAYKPVDHGIHPILSTFLHNG
jgi:hypothetical protein